MRRSVAGTVALLITVAFTAGCGGPGASGSTVVTMAPGTPASSSSPLGGLPSSGASLPPVPEGLPVMPGAEAQDPVGEQGMLARWTVDAIGPEVYAYYLDALPGAGFAIIDQLPGGNVAVLRFRTPAGTTLELTLVGEDGGERTRIGLRLPEGP